MLQHEHRASDNVRDDLGLTLNDDRLLDDCVNLLIGQTIASRRVRLPDQSIGLEMAEILTRSTERAHYRTELFSDKQ